MRCFRYTACSRFRSGSVEAVDDLGLLSVVNGAEPATGISGSCLSTEVLAVQGDLLERVLEARAACQQQLLPHS